MDRLQIKFFTRPGCKLCKEALGVLKTFENRYPLEIELVDISSSPRLLAAYQYDIPIATLGEEELFRHQPDRRKIAAVLKAMMALGNTGFRRE